jgi:hypothetical protein
MNGATNAAPAVDTYSHYYMYTDWATLCVELAHILDKFEVPTDGIIPTGQQFYEDIKQMCHKMPHAYVSLVKDDLCLVLLHRGTYHSTPTRRAPEAWNNRFLMFTGDVVENQVPQAVVMPRCYLHQYPKMSRLKIWHNSCCIFAAMIL